MDIKITVRNHVITMPLLTLAAIGIITVSAVAAVAVIWSGSVSSGVKVTSTAVPVISITEAYTFNGTDTSVLHRQLHIADLPRRGHRAGRQLHHNRGRPEQRTRFCAGYGLGGLRDFVPLRFFGSPHDRDGHPDAGPGEHHRELDIHLHGRTDHWL